MCIPQWRNDQRCGNIASAGPKANMPLRLQQFCSVIHIHPTGVRCVVVAPVAILFVFKTQSDANSMP